MPKLKPTDTQQANDILRGNVAKGLEMQRLNKVELASKMLISRASVCNKLRNPDTFTRGELRKLADTLKLTPLERIQLVWPEIVPALLKELRSQI